MGMNLDASKKQRFINSTLAACDFCKGRKIRCCLLNGTCKECMLRGLECIIKSPSLQRRFCKRKEKEWNKHIFVWNKADPNQPTTRLEPSIPPRQVRQTWTLAPAEESTILISLRHAESPAMLHVRDNWDSLCLSLDATMFRLLSSTLLARGLFHEALGLKTPSIVSPKVTKGIRYYEDATKTLSLIESTKIVCIPFIFYLLNDVFVMTNMLITHSL
ncbi:hypothetical protein DSO57_1020674 [Entomophthora muscae]|uniref:Uncharacterized protein n=1 Tax=Entomophthora muscae TaxID=34485 RepID=A0ACC2T3J5_9FUNG|nr:hypothetical protein DSO57_1020674 [Entomophthora muscae]